VLPAALRAAIAAAAVCVASLAAAQPARLPPDPADLLAVLDAALYPVQVMAYCYREVGQDPAYQDAGSAWVARNGDLLARVQALAKSAGVSDATRAAADRQTLADIERLIGSQGDPGAYCRLIAGIVNAGQFDLTIRDDLQAPMKRIFPTQ
jgi:hypothetical protein